MQSYLSRRSRDQRFSGGEFCEVISALTRDLTKARNQLVQLMHQVEVKPGVGRLYGGYSVPHKPPRTHSTPCNGSNVRNRYCIPAPRNSGCGNAYPSASVPSSRSLRSMTVHEANRLGQPQQRAPFRPQRKVSNCCERPRIKAQNPCERLQQQGSRSDMSDTSDSSGRSGQRDSTCVNITFDSSEPTTPAARRPQRCRRDTSTDRASKLACFQDSRDPARLQGGGISRRHDCVGTQFATLLQDVTYQLKECRLAANVLKSF